MWLGYFMLEMYLNISSSCGFSPFLLAANSGLDKETRYTGLIQCLFEGGVYSRVAFIQRNTVLSNHRPSISHGLTVRPLVQDASLVLHLIVTQ